jgi:transcriptional regulator with XRE-family HTH domain
MGTEFSLKLKQIRKQARLNQIQFAQSIGTSQATLSDLESGKLKPSFDVLVSIATMYSIDLDWLILDKNKDNAPVLKTNEQDILWKYRCLTPDAQEEVKEFLDIKLIRYKK